ncbi:transposase [Gordonia amicalis]|uniref:transposase n=1 Tax=Gordonia amicalis TaxID=89053 RepID=UPI00295558C0|nr:transposase [Gordonia amicalis]MDV7078979.1 transposase [Gordonia amicalis]
MARKNYPDEFKRDAVELYRDTEGTTITQIADELGILSMAMRKSPLVARSNDQNLWMTLGEGALKVGAPSRG